MANKRMAVLLGYVILSVIISCLKLNYIGLLFFGFFVLKGWLDHKAYLEKQEAEHYTDNQT